MSYEVTTLTRAWLGEPPPEPLNESELSWIWAGQRYPAGALQLVDGGALRVIHPGRAGGGAGPDFLDAVIEIDGRAVRGDVELHVRASGFRAHGHDCDPAYDGVVLHVVFRADDGRRTRLSSGIEAPVAAFAPWLEGRTEEIERWLAAEPLWREPCQAAIGRLGEEDVRAALREAGEERFTARVAALRALADELGEDEALWRVLFDVLGVGGDREGFRRLSRVFPGRLARELIARGDEDETQAHLAGALAYAAGLDERPRGATSGLPPPLRPGLAAPGRPANRPGRRLAGLAALYVSAGGDVPGFVRAGVERASDVGGLVSAWQVSRRGATLIGPQQARELALNLALPFAAGDPSLRSKAEALLAGMRAAPVYGKTAFLERNLRAASSRRLVRRALEQQGLLAFLAQWCSQGGCGRCPLS